jgi:hypothetical protein
MSEQIRAAQQKQVRIALHEIEEIPTKAEALTLSVSVVVFKEKAIATVEKNIQAVPLSKSAEIAERIGKMAAMQKSVEETKAHSYWGRFKLVIDRCINALTGHGAVTSSEWAQHVAKELQARHDRIIPIQEHFQKVEKGENILPADIQAAITRLSPEEIKKAVEENVFNIERLRNLGLYDKFEQSVSFSLMDAQRTAFKEALSLPVGEKRVEPPKSLPVREEKIIEKRVELPDTPDTIPEEVKKVFNRLFEGSSYKVEKLQIYPEVAEMPRLDLMTSPVMKAKGEDGRDLILIKVRTTVTQEQVEARELFGSTAKKLIQQPIQERFIVLYRYHEDEPEGWSEARKFQDYPEPEFFGGMVTNPANGRLLKSMEQDFANCQQLFSTGKAKDTRGVTWELAT